MEEELMFEKIERYLDREMAQGEQEAFEKEVQKNAELRRLVDESLRTRYAVHQAGLVLQKEQLKQEWEEVWEGKQSGKITPAIWMSMAAGIALLIVCGLYFFKATSMSSEELFAAHYELPEPLSERRLDSMQQARMAKGNTLYSQGDYASAAQEYERLLPSASPGQMNEIRFFLGICYLEMNKNQEALNQWKSLNSDYYQNSGKWYSALARIRLGQREEVHKILQQLIDSESTYYQTRARKLLKDL